MKYRVKVEEQWFEVEINDLTTRPVIAFVEGEPFEIWPEPSNTAVQPSRQPPASALPPKPKARIQGAIISDKHSLKVVRAPIPGVIISIAIQPPAEVAVGQ